MFRVRLLIAGLFIAGCTPSSVIPPTLTTEAIVTRVPTTVAGSEAPVATATPAARDIILKLWVEPAFGPVSEAPGSSELQAQLLRFEQANPGIEVELRVKRAVGAGGMLDSVRTASVAAPGALPDVIAVSSRSLHLAAAEGLIMELDDVVSSYTLDEIHDFALENSRWDGRLMGIPFASDALVAVYSVKSYSSPPRTWHDVLEAEGSLLIPAADLQALMTMQQYLALGGSLVGGDEDDTRITRDPLTKVFGHYADARILGILTPETLDYSTGADTWAAYRGRKGQIAVTSAHSYLLEYALVEASDAVTIPTKDGSRLALAETWSYALVNTGPDRYLYALALVNWLTQPENLGEWSLDAGYLPPMIDAVSLWPAKAPRNFAREILSASIPKPDDSVLSSAGPELSKAIARVILGQAEPAAAALEVVRAIGSGPD